MYIDDIDDLKDFSEKMKVIEQKYKSDFFLYVNMKNEMSSWGEEEQRRWREESKSF